MSGQRSASNDQEATTVVAFPDEGDANLEPPSYDESVLNASGVLSATRPAGGNTEFQRLLIEATFRSMTGHDIDASSLEHVDAETHARNFARRTKAFRTRMVHMMILSALVLKPIPPEVSRNVARYSRALGIDDDLLATVERFAEGDKAMAAVDFERNGYTADWSEERCEVLHTSSTLESGWDASEDDPDLAARWRALGDLDRGTLGRGVHDFYRARGFSFPGTPMSAPPLLAQHDWVHVLADYGTRVEAELEVFAFIARANDDPRGFSLLAMVVSLFETGYLEAGAGLFEAFPGQLSHEGMTERIGDAMRRGALSHGLDGAPDVDFMAVDWFEHAGTPLADVQKMFGLVPKSSEAVEAGSVTAWEKGGISEAQWKMGNELAERQGFTYQSFGASV